MVEIYIVKSVYTDRDCDLYLRICNGSGGGCANATNKKTLRSNVDVLYDEGAALSAGNQYYLVIQNKFTSLSSTVVSGIHWIN